MRIEFVLHKSVVPQGDNTNLGCCFTVEKETKEMEYGTMEQMERMEQNTGFWRKVVQKSAKSSTLGLKVAKCNFF